jgi:O-antigen biosynthesis protein
MKILSVVIVNYNVCHFLEQCLRSVEKACANIEAEVIVVDNNSVDGSVPMVREKFPWVKVIANKENTGFSRANNQAILQSEGEYVLLLNPDTVVEEDTFTKCIDFMDQHEDAGGLGVYMVDGKGQFLPESKRSMPTPAVAFYKIFGLSSLFPGSKRFGRYHLGYLDKHKTHEVEVLSGAFMMLRRAALDKTGLLDETFFMYGEDIDLSYRITQSGYKNYYYPGTRIIHYKGESTKKSSINYVFVFYQAMIIFARKHFSGKHARMFSLLINLAIYFRAAIAITRRTVMRLIYPVTDMALLWGGIYLIKEYWASHVRFGVGTDYPAELMFLVVPAYMLVWLVSMFFSGVYDKPLLISRVWKGMGAGTLIILVVYALLPETARFSRALIILGFFYASLALPFYRYLLSLTGNPAFAIDSSKQRRYAVIGNPDEAERVANIVRRSHPDAAFVGLVSIDNTEEKSGVLGHLGQLSEIIAVYQIQELIFCLRNIEAREIIDLMTTPFPGNPEFKIAPPESAFLVGSGSIAGIDELQSLHFNTIAAKGNRRNKRFLDIIISAGLLTMFPLVLPWQRNPKGFFRNGFRVLLGRKSWVGYHTAQPGGSNHQLPAIRNGVLGPADAINLPIDDEQMLQGLNLLYARDYQIQTDLKIIVNNFRDLGRETSPATKP